MDEIKFTLEEHKVIIGYQGVLYVSEDKDICNRKGFEFYYDIEKTDLVAKFLIIPQEFGIGHRIIDALSFPAVWYADRSYSEAWNHVCDLALEKLGIRLGI